jgi:dihydrofolate synthase/folylpolyglutamate synthase
MIRHDPLIIADVAHNPDGIRALVQALRDLHSGKFAVVFGVMQDKDYRTMIGILRPLARTFYFVEAATRRSRPAGELIQFAHDRGIPSRLGGSVDDGIRLSLRDNRGRDPVLITGSHYVAGEAMEALGFTP